MGLYREDAVVLRTYRLGEADRIIVLMTAGRGKVRAVAKGVRKTGSRFGGRLEPGGHVHLLLYEGRELDIVNQAEAVEPFRGIRDDLTRMRDALAVLEAVDQVAQEGEANRGLYTMLLGALRTLSAHPSPLVVAGFYWKLMALEGSAPMLERCVRCGAEGDRLDVVALDTVEGGVICRGCRPGAGPSTLSSEALALVRRILGGDLAGALTTPDGPVAAEVTELATRALEGHLERRLRVPRLLERS
jgi:DNA repair protein RecO (recombination protein O)